MRDTAAALLNRRAPVYLAALAIIVIVTSALILAAITVVPEFLTITTQFGLPILIDGRLLTAIVVVALAMQDPPRRGWACPRVSMTAWVNLGRHGRASRAATRSLLSHVPFPIHAPKDVFNRNGTSRQADQITWRLAHACAAPQGKGPTQRNFSIHGG